MRPLELRHNDSVSHINQGMQVSTIDIYQTHKKRIQGVIVIAISLLAYSLFQSNYKISYSPNAIYSLSHGVFLTEYSDTFERGDVVRFVLQEQRAIYPPGTDFAKIAAGVPGDTVIVSEYAVTVITPEGQETKYSVDMPYLTWKAGVDIQNYLKTYELKEGEWFSLGTHRLSVDSKLFGPESMDKIVGINYAIF